MIIIIIGNCITYVKRNHDNASIHHGCGSSFPGILTENILLTLPAIEHNEWLTQTMDNGAA
jgi:hypothetical protein